MHFYDLTPCRFGGAIDAARWNAPLLAIGWLEHPFPYRRGKVPAAVRDRLLELRDATLIHFAHHAFCGLHQCSICTAAKRGKEEDLYLSAINILVPGQGCVYAAPGAIDHYIAVHAYCPPQEFCDAALKCPECGSEAYWEELRTSNGGRVPLAHVTPVGERSFRVVWDSEA